MKNLKLRWRMWKTYTNKGDKVVHAIIVILYLLVSAAFLIDFLWTDILVLFGYAFIAYALIMKDVWKAAYTRTDGLRTLGASVTGALQEHAFIHITNAGGNYYIKPEHVGEHPDDMDGEIFTDEIVIRRGLDSGGERITAYRIPDDLSEVDVMGLLEITKQQYFYDKMELENE